MEHIDVALGNLAPVGRGKGSVDLRVIHGAEEGRPEAIAHLKDDGPMLMPKRMMNIAASDEDAPRLIETLIKANQPGNPGDGNIFVLAMEEAVRIRTGEHGTAALV